MISNETNWIYHDIKWNKLNLPWHQVKHTSFSSSLVKLMMFCSLRRFCLSESYSTRNFSAHLTSMHTITPRLWGRAVLCEPLYSVTSNTHSCHTGGIGYNRRPTSQLVHDIQISSKIHLPLYHITFYWRGNYHSLNQPKHMTWVVSMIICYA